MDLAQQFGRRIFNFNSDSKAAIKAVKSTQNDHPWKIPPIQQIRAGGIHIDIEAKPHSLLDFLARNN